MRPFGGFHYLLQDLGLRIERLGLGVGSHSPRPKSTLTVTAAAVSYHKADCRETRALEREIPCNPAFGGLEGGCP